MKFLGTLFSFILVAVVACAQVAPIQPVRVNGTGELQESVTVASGKSVTIASGGTLTAASGSTVNLPAASVSWASVNAPATILYSSSTYSDPSWLTGLAWSKVTGEPTTAAGYGITNGANLDLLSAYNPTTLPVSTATTSAIAASAATLQSAIDAKQDIDAELTAWAALATSAKQDASANLTAWASINPTSQVSAATQTALNAKQDITANLTAWNALATSAKQDAHANLTSWAALAPNAKQDADADLTSWAAIAPSAKQDADADLTAWAGIAPVTKADVSSLATVATSGSAADLSTGTLPAARLPAHTGDATSSAGSAALTLATVNSNVGTFGSTTLVPVVTVNAKGLVTAVTTAAVSGGGTSDYTALTNVPANITSWASVAPSAKQNTITTGSTAQYLRGDLSLATLNKAAVGLTNIDDTADADKPVSLLQGEAIANKGRTPLTAARALSLSAAESAFNPDFTISDCINPNALTGAVAAYWDGDYFSGTLREKGTNVAIVVNSASEYLALFRSASDKLTNWNSPSLFARAVLPEDLVGQTTTANSGSAGYAFVSGKSMYEFYVGANAASASRVSAARMYPIPPLNSIRAAYFRFEASIFGAESASANEYHLTFGFGIDTTNYTPDANTIAFTYDRANTNAVGNTGNSHNLLAIAKAGGSYSTDITPYRLNFNTTSTVRPNAVYEIFVTSTEAQFYFGGNLVGIITTNLPTTANLSAGWYIKKSTNNGTEVRLCMEKAFVSYLKQ